MRTRLALTLILVLTLILAAASTLSAQTPDLSGIWRLNIPQSFLGQDHPFPDYQLTRTIHQAGDTLSISDASVHNSFVNIPLPDSTVSYSVTTDGKERAAKLPSSLPGAPPATAQVTATWQAGTLEIVQSANGLAAWGKQRLFLSPDAAHLIVLVEQHSVYGDSEQRLLFDKAP
jgi:hypothetical protein